MHEVSNTQLPKPATAPSKDALPHATTFFLSHGERGEVLRRLREIHADRTQALRIALGLTETRKAGRA